jgi:hypothetical protein
MNIDPVGKYTDPNALESPSSSDASFNHVLELKRLYRKLDRRIIPCLWVLYFLASSSRSTVGLALTMNLSTGDGLSQKLGLSEHEISTGVALFYVAYVIFEVPSNLVSTSLLSYGIDCSDEDSSSCMDCKDSNVHWHCCGLSCGIEFSVVILLTAIPPRCLRSWSLARSHSPPFRVSGELN